MQYRVVTGIAILVVLLVCLPVTAMPEIGLSQSAGEGRVIVLLGGINGTGMAEKVLVTYQAGEVFEFPALDVFENPETGIVSLSRTDSVPARQFMLIQKTPGDIAYRVRSVTVAAESEPLLMNDRAFAAVPATSMYYMDVVPEGKQHEWVDLDWKDKNKDLNLTVYAPDSTLGPYSDVSDGKKDGRIFLDVSSLFNVTPGSWFFKVQNSRQEYTPYTLNTYSA